jgi:hypothetical protein
MLLVMLMVGAGACERQPQESVAPSIDPQNMLASPGPVSKPPALIPMPDDKAELDRLILAGYTPHSDHLHAPGVNECPLTKGSDVVM